MQQAFEELQNSNTIVSSQSQSPPSPQPTDIDKQSFNDALYIDAITLIMMQQAAAAAVTSGSQQAMLMSGYPFTMRPLLAWGQQQQMQAFPMQQVSSRFDNELTASKDETAHS